MRLPHQRGFVVQLTIPPMLNTHSNDLKSHSTFSLNQTKPISNQCKPQRPAQNRTGMSQNLEASGLRSSENHFGLAQFLLGDTRMTILVTGATGRVGWPVVNRLEAKGLA
jgi:hypothetical protein